MLDNLVTPIVAVAIILGITLPIWFLVLLVRLVHQVARIAYQLELMNDAYIRLTVNGPESATPRVTNSMFGR